MGYLPRSSCRGLAALELQESLHELLEEGYHQSSSDITCKHLVMTSVMPSPCCRRASATRWRSTWNAASCMTTSHVGAARSWLFLLGGSAVWDLFLAASWSSLKQVGAEVPE